MAQGTRHIGVMVDSLDGYGEKILTGISRHVHQRSDWRVAFFDRERQELADLVGSWRGDGIICSAVDSRFAEAAASRDIPIVNVTSRHIDPVFTHVIGDDRLVGKLAAEFLLGRGFQSFAFVKRGEIERFSTERGEGFSDTLAVAGFKAEILSISPGMDEEIPGWLASRPRPLAVLGSTDRLASMVLDACWKENLRVPEEVAVLGVGNYDQLCDLCSPTLSSVDVDMERRGQEAARWMDLLLDGGLRPADPVLIPPIFVSRRRSTDVYAFDDPDVVAALRFIHGNAARTIKVGDVVAATTISRRTLEGRFSNLLSRTLHEEIWQAHFDLATRLLTRSDFSLQQVAESSGFRTASALVNLFRQRFEMTPKEYRVAHRR